MARKIKRTRLELKRQRDDLERFERYLPMLKLKQQQLQVALNELRTQFGEVRLATERAQATVDGYKAVLADPAGVDVAALATCAEIRTTEDNVAGVNVPVFEGVTFPEASYSLFGTPPWVDRALVDHRELSRCRAHLETLQRRYELIDRELTRVIQRVNLFEKVKIPACQEAIRVIRIALGDEMTAAVVRAKIAKVKLEATEAAGAEALAGKGASE